MPRTIAHILVPLDFSPPTDAALDYATAVASRCGATVYLLHVVDEPCVPDERDDRIDAAARRLSHLLRRIERRSVPARSEVRTGHPARAICDAVNERAIDLIVMGAPHPAGGQPSAGSVSACVLREAPCPVLMVPQPAARECAA